MSPFGHRRSDFGLAPSADGRECASHDRIMRDAAPARIFPDDQGRAGTPLFRRRSCSRPGTPGVVPRASRRLIRKSTLPISVIHSKSEAPRIRSLVVIPRQLIKAASAPLELDPLSTRIFRCRATFEPEMRPADVCNPHVKDEHPLIRVASGFVIEVALDLTGGRCVHIATARFGQSPAARAGVFFPLGLATEPGPLMSPSPIRWLRSRSSLDRTGQDRSYRHPMRWASAFPIRDTFHRQRSPPRTLSRHPAALSTVHRFTNAVSPAAGISHLRLGPVRVPSRNREPHLEPSVAYRLLLPTRNPSTTANAKSSHVHERFHVLPLPNRGEPRRP
jgi:hypothetical protein